MILTMELTGSLPVLTEDALNAFAQEVVREMDIMVRENMAESGRPEKWPPLRSGKNAGQASHLYETGFLYSNITDSVTTEGSMTVATVGVPPGKVLYAGIHQFGGEVNFPGTDKPVPIQTPNGLIFRYMKKPRTFYIPPRPYLVWVDSTVEWIKQNTVVRFVSILKVNQEPL